MKVLSNGQIEMKVYPNKDNIFSFYTNTNKINIDWGDGIFDEFIPNAHREYIHEYSNQNIQTISVLTESMTSFRCSQGTLHELRFGKCTELERVSCSQQKLTVLDIKNAVSSLETLECSENLLVSLDVSGASMLRCLYSDDNQLTLLNVDGCILLKDLFCDKNQLTQLNLNSCKSIETVYCSSNKLSATTLNTIFKNLPVGDNTSKYQIFVKNNPGDSSCEKSILWEKGWYY